MNDKERLEKIKEIDISPLCFYLNEMTNFDGKLLKGYWKWLIKQAERAEKNAQDLEDMDKQLASEQKRVEKLELEVNDWRAEAQKWQQFYKESEESHLETKELLKSILNQNKCYREAINNIIEKAMLFGTNEEAYDAIQDAIQVLEGEE